MKYSKSIILLFPILLLILFVGSPQTGLTQDWQSRIHPYLQNLLNTAEEEEYLPVYIMLNDRLSLEYLQTQTRGMNKKERRKTVVKILKEHAARTQQGVLNSLMELQSREMIGYIENIWSINMLAFKSRPAAVYELARKFSEIEQIRYDRPISREEATDDLGISKYNEENNLVLGPAFAPQQGLILINAPAVWAEGDSGQGVILANVDGGADWDHPDLVRNLWNNLGEDANGNGRTVILSGSTWIFDPGDVNGVDDDNNGKVDDFIGWNFSNNSNDPSTSSISHGTSTAGILVGDGTNGTETGVAPRAKLMDLNINTAGESGWMAAYQYAFENGADVTTSSFSSKWYFSPQPNYPMFRQTSDMELAAGTLHTNSTSNDGNTTGIPFNISAPGCVPGPWVHPDQTLVGGVSSVIGSADVNASSDLIVSSSPWGPYAWEDYRINHPSYPYAMPLAYQDYPYETIPGSMGLIKPDVAAPGSGTTSLSPGGGYSSFGGTSGATPHLAGVAGLMLSANPDLEPEDLSRIMQTTAVEKGDPGKDNRYGAGRVDAYAAYLRALAEAGSPNAPSDLTAYSDYRTPTGMTLTWSDPTNLLNGDTLLIGHYHIHIERDGVLIDSVPGGLYTFNDSGLNDGQLYSYEIFCKVDSNLKISGKIEDSWIAGGSPIPLGVEDVGISSSGQEVTLYWRNPSDNIDGTPMDDLAGVNVYMDDNLVTSFVRSGVDTGRADSGNYMPGTGGFHRWYLTAYDNEIPANESQISMTVISPLNIPIVNFFQVAGLPDSLTWRIVDVDINDRSVSPPSGPLALNFNGKPNGADSLELYPTDLRGYEGQGLVLSYYYQPQGQGNAPEPGDSLKVEFLNSAGEWMVVRSYPGSPVVPFVHEIIDLDSEPSGSGTFYHSQFQLRLSSRGLPSVVTPNDDWFVDDLYFGIEGPLALLSRDSVFFDTTAVGTSRSDSLWVVNQGLDSLHVTGMVVTNGVFSVESSQFVLDVGDSLALVIRFTPVQGGVEMGWLRMLSDHVLGDTLDIYVEGIGEGVSGIAGDGLLPRQYSLSQNYPNPFNPVTWIHYELPVSGEVRLEIYNILGQRVRSLVSGWQSAGRYDVEWRGENDGGLPQGSGIYMYRFRSGDYNRTLKMMLMK